MRQRAKHHALIKSVHPAEHFFDHLCRVAYNPYRLQHCTEIKIGLGSPLYCGKLLEHIIVKKTEIDLYSAHVGRDLKIETLNLVTRAASAKRIQQAAELKAAFIAEALVRAPAAVQARDLRFLVCASAKASHFANLRIYHKILQRRMVQ